VLIEESCDDLGICGGWRDILPSKPPAEVFYRLEVDLDDSKRVAAVKQVYRQAFDISAKRVGPQATNHVRTSETPI
jgi:hypothetical protein